MWKQEGVKRIGPAFAKYPRMLKALGHQARLNKHGQMRELKRKPAGGRCYVCKRSDHRLVFLLLPFDFTL